MKIIVMLIWIGGYHGGPTTIQGFDSLDACNEQKQIVIDGYKSIINSDNAVTYIELSRFPKINNR